MAKISKFPLKNGGEGPSSHLKILKVEDKSEENVLDVVLQLIWDDADAFMLLERKCWSNQPFLFDKKAELKLKELGLTNNMGVPTPEVKKIIYSLICKKQSVMSL